MSTAIPSGFTFEMLSRLPPNSFVMEWREFRTDAPPPSRWGYPLDTASSHRLNFSIRGAPNEFLLNTNAYLSGDAWFNIRNEALASDESYIDEKGLDKLIKQATGLKTYVVAEVDNDAVEVGFYAGDTDNAQFGGLGSPYMYFNSSRESFNSGALPFLDNQDAQRSKDINTLRLLCANGSRAQNGNFGIESCTAPWSFPTIGRRNEQLSNWLDSGLFYYGPINEDSYGCITKGGVKRFHIPVGLYSSLINSHSVLPIGLFSSYAVNGYQIELYTNSQPIIKSTNPGSEGTINSQKLNLWVDGRAWPDIAGDEPKGNSDSLVYDVGGNAYMRNLVIRMQVIKVLDPAVMEAVLSLYEKRESVNLGGIQFPLSLRMNSLGYRFYNQVIQDGKSEYHFRIPTTDRSVRAVAWYVQYPSFRDFGYMGTPLPIRPTKIDTRIGTEIIHPTITDVDPYSNNCGNFIDDNFKRCSSLFSPFPQYLEGNHPRDKVQDLVSRMNNLGGTFTDEYALQLTDGNYTTNGAYGSPNGITMGAISFENLDRREGDFQTSYQASGKDLTNIGSIEMIIGFHQAQSVDTGNPLDAPQTQDQLSSKLQFIAPQQAFDITFITVYDNVMEVSPQGIMDITNAVL